MYLFFIQAGVSISIDEIEKDATELKNFTGATKTAQVKRKRKQGLCQKPSTSGAAHFTEVGFPMVTLCSFDITNIHTFQNYKFTEDRTRNNGFSECWLNAFLIRHGKNFLIQKESMKAK